MGLSAWLERTAVPWFTSLGLTRRTVTLEVPGRKSGKPRRNPEATVEVGDSRYLVSVHGESQWVKNVRAANGEAVIIHGGRLPVMLSELQVDERAPVLLAYVSEGSFGRSAADIARQFGVEAEPSLEEMQTLVEKHPVFKIETRS